MFAPSKIICVLTVVFKIKWLIFYILRIPLHMYAMYIFPCYFWNLCWSNATQHSKRINHAFTIRAHPLGNRNQHLSVLFFLFPSTVRSLVIFKKWENTCFAGKEAARKHEKKCQIYTDAPVDVEITHSLSLKTRTVSLFSIRSIL